jgi:hypothetical protein
MGEEAEIQVESSMLLIVHPSSFTLVLSLYLCAFVAF